MANSNQNELSMRLFNQLSNLNTSLLDLRLSRGGNANMSGPTRETCPPDQPNTLRDLLCTLVGNQVQVTTPFGEVAGTLIAVRDDYIVMVDDTGTQVLVRIDVIEAVSEL
ncbi:DUF2642 domain-containing protein [Natribacillus halophilus]|uniref:DUF2642 domain-containing protein n=1 Tax=Natribacillus halophilus TaxID=549003 RepID=A0A1G8P2J0_9BACI|nr:DUF2642 domain-containing protein [Natribacillus halophilus]SDI86575.1 Protein of unknown function [Natribacillus halophilus]